MSLVEILSSDQQATFTPELISSLANLAGGGSIDQDITPLEKAKQVKALELIKDKVEKASNMHIEIQMNEGVDGKQEVLKVILPILLEIQKQSQGGVDVQSLLTATVADNIGKQIPDFTFSIEKDGQHLFCTLKKVCWNPHIVYSSWDH
jgi:hypothetical protein